MTRLLIYMAVFGLTLYFMSRWSRQQSGFPAPSQPPLKPGRAFMPKKNPREVWVQVYETSTLEEARMLQARLEEENLECIVYEQGKKDIHGNLLKGIGIAVPKTAVPHAQRIVSRMPA